MKDDVRFVHEVENKDFMNVTIRPNNEKDRETADLSIENCDFMIGVVSDANSESAHGVFFTACDAPTAISCMSSLIGILVKISEGDAGSDFSTMLHIAFQSEGYALVKTGEGDHN